MDQPAGDDGAVGIFFIEKSHEPAVESCEKRDDDHA